MLEDPTELALADLLKADLPGPRPGWEVRALAALAGVRPRRHPNLVRIIVVTLILLILAAGAYAAVRLLIPGTLSFNQARRGGGPPDWTTGVYSGELTWQTAEQAAYWASIAPRSGRRAYEQPPGLPPGYTGAAYCDICVSDPDGRNEVNLTERAGLHGVNCGPKWSPDERMIVLQHTDPVKGQRTCDAGFQIWVMNADGSDAHQVLPKGSSSSVEACWSPDGSRLVATYDAVGGTVTERTSFSTDLWGTDVRLLPDVGGHAAWSPDGSLIAGDRFDREIVDGHPGYWRRLVVTKADGSDPDVVAQQFVSDADTTAHVAAQATNPGKEPDLRKMTPDFARDEISNWVGPNLPVWSPDGSKIAFLAAMLFDPKGIFYRDQIEVWVYDLQADQLTRLTHDNVAQECLHWTK